MVIFSIRVYNPLPRWRACPERDVVLAYTLFTVAVFDRNCSRPGVFFKRDRTDRNPVCVRNREVVTVDTIDICRLIGYPDIRRVVW
jgi:hypothetical protein